MQPQLNYPLSPKAQLVSTDFLQTGKRNQF